MPGLLPAAKSRRSPRRRRTRPGRCGRRRRAGSAETGRRSAEARPAHQEQGPCAGPDPGPRRQDLRKGDVAADEDQHPWRAEPPRFAGVEGSAGRPPEPCERSARAPRRSPGRGGSRRRPPGGENVLRVLGPGLEGKKDSTSLHAAGSAAPARSPDCGAARSRSTRRTSVLSSSRRARAGPVQHTVGDP